MKFDPSKAWPHPVLRPPTYGDDYPYAEFEVETDLKRVQGSTSVEVDAEFQLSDPDLLRLVDEGSGKYVLLLKASRTHFRDMIESDNPHITRVFPAGDLSGRVELAPFLVCTRELVEFRANGWHEDFAGRTFNIAVGSVLAEDMPKEYWVDTADEAQLGSIFGHRPRANIPNGQWKCELAEDRIWIVMSPDDSVRYDAARNGANSRPEGQYLMNGLYLPALISVLYDVDRSHEDYRDCRWFAFLDQRLQQVECLTLGATNADRLADAQKILDWPFPRMPMIAEAEGA